MIWYVYIIYSASSGRLYTGISTDPSRRLSEHNSDTGAGAKATRAGRPWKIVHTETMPSRSAALRREAVIKKMSRLQKFVLAGLAA